MVVSPGGISPAGAPRSVREPLDSHGSRCSAVSMAQLPMSEERRICSAKPIKPVACSFGFETQPFEFAARPADDIEVNPLQGRTQLRSVEVAVVVDPASNARVVHLGQIWQGFVAAVMKRPAYSCVSPYGPAILVTHGQQRTHALQQNRRGFSEFAGQACSSPSSAFASFRSSVSNPSVNQP